MSSTFMGLNIGGSALSSFQTSVSTTANNIANAKTVGYSRQTATLNSTDPLRVTAKYGSVGTGVEVTAVKQERDAFYDARYWKNNSSLGMFESKVYYLEQIQTYFKDDNSQTGFSTLFQKMFNNLDTLIAEGPGDESVRNQFINSAQNLCAFFNSLSASMTDLQADVNEEVKSTTENINSISKKISLLNAEIYAIEVRGGVANELRDDRANLVDELSKLVSVETREYEVVNTYGENLGATNFSVTINGQMLVDGFDYRTLECKSQSYNNNQNDLDGLYSIVWSDTGMSFAATTETAGGSLKSLFTIRDGNNGECLKGTVGVATNTSITLEMPNITDISKLSIAEHGQLTINNKTYEYDGWTAQTDADGNITSFTFNLTEPITDARVATLNGSGKKIECGKAVEGMGIPYYMSQINEFVRAFTKLFNDIQKEGQTLDGDPMGSFFIANNFVDGTEFDLSDWGDNGIYTLSSRSNTYYKMTGATLSVTKQSMLNPRYFSTTENMVNGVDAYDIVEKLKPLRDKVEVFRGDSAGAFLETLLSDVAVDTNEANTFCATYTSLEASIGNLRTSVSGVDEDEEAINLVKFQNAYNMASKVISVMSEMYDKLINQTGV